MPHMKFVSLTVQKLYWMLKSTFLKIVKTDGQKDLEDENNMLPIIRPRSIKSYDLKIREL